MHTDRTQHDSGDADAGRLLAIYLRDHRAGAAAGVALITRCRRNNSGTGYADTLAEVEQEIREDCDRLESIMAGLDVRPSRTKTVLGSVTELLARVKSNGRVFRYSPSSRVIELETLMAGVATKGHLWRALRVASAPAPDRVALDDLERRAANQLLRLTALHERAAAEAFAARQHQQAGSTP